MFVGRQPFNARGYTLVEVLVAIGIVSVLILGVFIPILDSSRDVARRLQCQHNMRELGMGVVTLESAQRVFPSGGTHPRPNIRKYVNRQSIGTPVPFGPEKQGLGWMYQILPYLPSVSQGQPTHALSLDTFETNLFFCPARRGVTRSSSEPHRSLSDYAAIVPPPSRAQLGKVKYEQLIQNDEGCNSAYGFWGVKNYGNDHYPRSSNSLGANYVGFWGMFVRSSYYVDDNGYSSDLDYSPQTTIRRVRDGLSRTAMITEKFVSRSEYSVGDDSGWADGWSYDTMRSSFCSPMQDSHNAGYSANWTAGSNHPSGLHVVMADGSVRFVAYGIDTETWHRMGHRSNDIRGTFGEDVRGLDFD